MGIHPGNFHRKGYLMLQPIQVANSVNYNRMAILVVIEVIVVLVHHLGRLTFKIQTSLLNFDHRSTV